jgi:hypothetical protein
MMRALTRTRRRMAILQVPELATVEHLTRARTTAQVPRERMTTSLSAAVGLSATVRQHKLLAATHQRPTGDTRAHRRWRRRISVPAGPSGCRCLQHHRSAARAAPLHLSGPAAGLCPRTSQDAGAAQRLGRTVQHRTGSQSAGGKTHRQAVVRVGARARAAMRSTQARMLPEERQQPTALSLAAQEARQASRYSVRPRRKMVATPRASLWAMRQNVQSYSRKSRQQQLRCHNQVRNATQLRAASLRRSASQGRASHRPKTLERLRARQTQRSHGPVAQRRQAQTRPRCSRERSAVLRPGHLVSHKMMARTRLTRK